MKSEHKQYILSNLDRQSYKEIAQHLNIREKHVHKFVDQEHMKGRLSENRAEEQASPQKSPWILCVALIVLTGCMIYGNSLNGQFIWDDERLIQNNPAVKDWGRVGEMFTSTLRTPLAKATSAFRPLQTFTYLIDYSIGQLNVFGYHVTNVLFHILAALAFFWLIQILFRDLHLSFFTALIFLVHPLHTEAVAYISGRADPMMAFFMVLSFCFYLNIAQRSTALGFGMMCLSFLGALLSRENALIFPIIILFYHYAFKKTLDKKAFAALLVTAMIYLIWRWMIFQGLVLEQSTPTTIWQRTPGIFVALANYVRLLLVPFGLHMEYGGVLFHWNEPKIYIGLVLILGLICFAHKNRENLRIIFPIGWFFITLLPVMNIVPLNSYMAEHWLYIPLMGYALIMAHFITCLYKKDNGRAYAVMVCTGLMMYYGGMTIYQNTFWHDPITFYKRTLKYNPNSTRLYTNLAGEFLKADQKEDLIGMLEKAIAIDSTNAVAYNNLGNAYKGLGKITEAISVFKKSIELNPNYAGPEYNLGVIYIDVIDDPQKAVVHLHNAIVKDSAFPRAYHKLGRIYLDQGKKDEAIALLNKAAEIDPDNPDIYHSLAYTYFQSGNVTEALIYYKKTIDLNPRHGEAYKNLAVIHYNNEQYRKAIEYCDQAVAMGYIDQQLLEILKPYR